MSSNPLHICTRHVFRVMTAMLRAAALLCLCVTALSISADPDPETDPFLARYINALHAYNNNSAFASPTELSAALFPAWKQLFRGRWAALPLRVANYHNATRVAIIIESRADVDLPGLIKHTMWMLNHPSHQPNTTDSFADSTAPQWALHIFHTPENAELLRRGLNLAPHDPRVKLTLLPYLTRNTYSALTTSTAFLQQFSAEHFLIFQNDVAMLRPDSLDEFLEYDYLGAPWSWCKQPESYCWRAGNGGASLRRRSSMLQLIRELVCDRWQCSWQDIYSAHEHNPQRNKEFSEEDTWLAGRMNDLKDQLQLNLPPRHISHRFAAETLLPRVDQMDVIDWITENQTNAIASSTAELVEPVFFHATWKYVNPEALIGLMAQTQRYYWSEDSFGSIQNPDPYLSVGDYLKITEKRRLLNLNVEIRPDGSTS